MKSRAFRYLFLIPLVFYHAPASAGKIDQVKKAVKESCKKDLADSEIMNAILKAYDCNAGTEVKVAGCSIKCLKENSGNVVGK